MSATPASSKRCLKGRCLLFGGRDRAWRCRTFNNFKIYSYSRVPNPDQSRLPLCDKTLCKLKEKNVFDKVGYGLWGLEYPPSLSLSLARLNGDCLFWQDLVGCQIVNFSWCCLVSAFAYDWRQLRKGLGFSFHLRTVRKVTTTCTCHLPPNYPPRTPRHHHHKLRQFRPGKGRKRPPNRHGQISHRHVSLSKRIRSHALFEAFDPRA